jgi:fructosamine-3-kinase
MAACWQGSGRQGAIAMHDWVSRQLGSEVVARRPVGGGCIHSAWCLELADGRRVFAKTSSASALPLLAAEAEGLAALARWAAPPLRLPEPLALGVSGDAAVLLLSWLELASAGHRGDGWASLGACLADLHRASAAGQPGQGYGFGSDNFIGSSPQTNGWMARWPEFFVDRRLAPQLARAAQRGGPFPRSETLLARAAELLADHGCSPVLVHGDLWSGNAAVLADGTVAIFDPAAYWGDREVDLAMARLFGGFPEPFFAGYTARWPLPADWPQRLDLYNLYHLINHANLFGGGYRGQAQAVIDRLLR